MGHWIRTPRTAAEMRANAGALPYVRAKRRPWALPTSWDDAFRHTEKCWKRTRRTQYHRIPTIWGCTG